MRLKNRDHPALLNFTSAELIYMSVREEIALIAIILWIEINF